MRIHCDLQNTVFNFSVEKVAESDGPGGGGGEIRGEIRFPSGVAVRFPRGVATISLNNHLRRIMEAYARIKGFHSSQGRGGKLELDPNYQRTLRVPVASKFIRALVPR